ncbi:DUF3305 domain-containing protein [Flaviflagellibacter deserti]|uniref:DUF3305 domain-containing protein n=1 Tax=Flaviflagellibacter deserti TaxID=2267266 RepID=A0ABV9Z2G3_9HYPH
MASVAFKVGVIVERHPAVTQWADYSWRVSQVLVEPPEIPIGTVLKNEAGVLSLFAGYAEVEFHSVESGNYRDNLASGQPSLWVVLEAGETPGEIDLVAVLADPAEGEAMTEAGDLIVEAVPMPASLAAELVIFVAQHHVEQVFVKRIRD